MCSLYFSNCLFSHFVFISLTFVEPPGLRVCSSPSFLFLSQPLSSPLSPLPRADAPCGSPSTWEKPHTSPDKVTNPSHFTAPSHCSLGMFKTVCMCVRVCLIGDRREYVTQVQGGGFFCCNKQLRQPQGSTELWLIREITPLQTSHQSDITSQLLVDSFFTTYVHLRTNTHTHKRLVFKSFRLLD